MADTTNPLPSITEPVVDRYRRWNPLWYRFIKPLIDTVRSNGVSIEQLENSYTISVNQNGRVIGSIKLDGSDGTSTFAILADKFVVVNPTDDGNTITAFAVGLVDGVPTVGINGQLIVDGSLYARQMNADVFNGQIFIGSLFTSADGTCYFDTANKELVMTT